MLREIEYRAASGIGMLVAMVAAFFGTVGAVIWAVNTQRGSAVAGSILFLLIILVCLPGFFVVNPGEAKVLQLLGKYAGTVRE